MKLEMSAKLAAQSVPWLHEQARDSDVVLSSRVRLARNLTGIPFPSRAAQQQREALFHDLSQLSGALHAISPLLVAEVPDLSDIDRQVFRERHLISQKLCEKGKGSGVVVDDSQSLSMILNEEDHLRIQAISPGLDLSAAWRRVDALDNELAQHRTFAFDKTLGYLTACPTNVGTGMRASAMMHLPGLALSGMIPRVCRAGCQLGIAVRGQFGEGTEAVGHIFQLSNQATLGETEVDIIARLEGIFRQLVWSERNARRNLLAKRRNELLDVVGKAYGRLRYGYMLSSKEAVNQLCDLRLGACLGVLPGLNADGIGDLIAAVLPGHLQLGAGCALSGSERAAFRARTIREKLAAKGTSAA